MIDLATVDPHFESDLRKSDTAVVAVAMWLRSIGRKVAIPPISVRGDIEHRSEFSDRGDLEIVQRAEVKWRMDLDFNSKEAFGYDTVIVDVVHSWDNAQPKPVAYFICNKSLSGCLQVDTVRTRDGWTVGKRFDKHCGRERSFYFCPVNHAGVTYQSLAR